MKLSQPTKVLIGLAPLWVILYPLLFFPIVLVMIVGMPLPASISEEYIFFAILPLHCLTIVLQVGLMVFYLAHIIKNITASETVRIVLGVGAFFFPYIAMPIYY